MPVFNRATLGNPGGITGMGKVFTFARVGQ